MSRAPSAAPFNRNCTLATPLTSAAVAATVTVPATVAPEAGLVTVTAGPSLSTVTETGADSPWLPAASTARAVIACVPAVTVVESHVAWYGELVSGAPSATPST